MLTKEEFVNYINRLKELYSASENLSTALANYDNTPDFGGFSNFRAIGLVEELLAKIMKDPEDEYGYTTISFFTTDLNFGQDYQVGCFSESDGTPIDLSTAEKLYDYLVKNAK